VIHSFPRIKLSLPLWQQIRVCRIPALGECGDSCLAGGMVLPLGQQAYLLVGNATQKGLFTLIMYPAKLVGTQLFTMYVYILSAALLSHSNQHTFKSI